MRLVDEAMDLVQGGHHLEEQHREGEDVAVGDPAAHEQVDGAGDDDQVEESLIERLAAAEQRHLEVVPELGRPPPLGRLLDPPDLQLVRVGGADVVETRKLLDDRSIHRLPAPEQAEPDPLLRHELPDRQAERERDHPGHGQRHLGLPRQRRRQGEAPGDERRDEVEEADPEEPDHPFDAPGDPPVQGPHLLLGQDRKVGLHQVRDQPDAHVPIDPGADVLDQVTPQDVHDLADQVRRAHDRQIERGGPKQRRLRQRLVPLGIDRIDQLAERKRDRRVRRTGDPHDQHRTPQRQALRPRHQTPGLDPPPRNAPDLAQESAYRPNNRLGHGPSFWGREDSRGARRRRSLVDRLGTAPKSASPDAAIHRKTREGSMRRSHGRSPRQSSLTINTQT